jgi:tetratricopeptide (TPR) repeat protein
MAPLNYSSLLVIACCLYLSSYGQPQARGTVFPVHLQQQLGQCRQRNDLVGWIYGQLQWVAQAPASRAGILEYAVNAAWRQPGSNEERQAWLDLLVNQGYALLMCGDIVRSTDAYTAAFHWARQYKEITDDALVLENILKPLGNNYTRLGDYEQALFIHRKALSVALSLNDKDALAGTCSNLANTSSNMGLPLQSLAYCQQGLQVADRHSALCGLLLSEQADALERSGRTGEAEESIRQSIAVLEMAAGPTARYWLLTAYQQAGDIYTGQSGPPATALHFYRKAIGLQQALLQQDGTLRRRDQAKLFERMATLCARMGKVDRAGYWLDQCLSVLVPGKKIDSLQETDLYAENALMDLLFTRAGLECRKAGLEQRQQHLDRALRYYALGFVTEKKLRYELVSGSSKEQSVADSRLRFEEAIHTAWDLWESTQAKKYQQAILAFMESSKSRLLLEEVRQQQSYHSGNTIVDSLTARIRLLEMAQAYYRKEAIQSPNNDSLIAADKVRYEQLSWDLAALRKKVGAGEPSGPADVTETMDSLFSFLPDGQAVRSFFAGTNAVYTLECTGAGIRFVEKLDLPGSWQDSIHSFIHTYFEQGANAMINHPRDYYRDGYAIYKSLFSLHPLQQGTEYILLPDGVLSLLPVDALLTAPTYSPSPAGWPFVVRRALLSYGWSLETLREQSVRASGGKDFSGFFLSGNKAGGVSSPLLEAVGAERSGIRQVLSGGNWYTNEQATTAAFRRALQVSAVVHISSHAFTEKDSLDAPHIELYDAPFYLFELKGMERHPALVVLSACRTGGGRMVAGEGVQSLARALTGNGTNAVVAGWWNVNDETTAPLMKEFYADLISLHDREGFRANGAKALRNARLAWLKDMNSSYLYKLPYYWAALNYMGNPTPLSSEFAPGSETISVIPRKTSAWWLLVLLLPVGMLLIRRR